MSRINLDTQVGNGPLDKKYGGTSNTENYSDGMIRRYFNRDAGVLDLGAVLSLRDATESGSISVKKTVTLDDPDVLGVCIGTFTLYGPDKGKLEFSAPSNNMEVAVLSQGRTSLLSVGSNGGVTRGQYIYAVGSNGQVYGETRLHKGAIGRWLANGSNGVSGSLAQIGLPFGMAPYGMFITANVVLDGGGAALTTGQKVRVISDFDAIIDGWTAVADTDGSMNVEIWKSTYSGYPPNIGDKITGSTPIAIASNSRKNFSNVLSGWSSTTITKGDVMVFNISTIETFTNVTIGLRLQRVT